MKSSESSLKIDLHKLAKFANIALPLILVVSLLAGIKVSFYFHFLTVTLLFMLVINFFYRHVQKAHTVLRNFGILGQARYLIESIGPEFRQYLFLNDTEERPFNRNERSEVYRKAKNVDSASSFGSLDNFDADEIKIRHSMYPLGYEDKMAYSLTIGEERGIDSAYTLTKPIMISAMSYGALGSNAVRSLARGAKMSGIPMNTGEGGYPKYHLMEGCDLIFQLGTAKFGVRNEDGTLDEDKLRTLASEASVKMIEIKFSQGAKPGKGGLLPKEKITKEIAKLRDVPMGQDVVSPTHHVECVDPESTVKFIRHVQEVSALPVGIKLCVGCFNEFRQLVHEMKAQDVFPDYISIDGAEGGTGAAPKAFMDKLGVPLLPALQGVNAILTEENVRDRLKLFAAGKLISPGKWITAMCLGADAVYSARGFMLALGCIQALQCGNNTCPVGITTHDPELAKGLIIPIKATRVQNYVDNSVHDFEELMRSSGCRSVRELTPERLYIPRGTSLFHDDPAAASNQSA
jgi:glutamate synthase domain-containing protein 2